ncbi:MAG: winged helix-turn-helix domain-containing protein [Candidatus Lokiarchaeota archaeon]
MKTPQISHKLFGLFKSKKRIKILDLFLNNSNPLHFNEIAKKLSISPSTLEYHLKKLEEENLITHNEDLYAKNAYLKLIWNTLKGISNLSPLLPYLKTHTFPIDDPHIILKFINSNPVFIPDMITMLTYMREKELEIYSKVEIAGSFDLTLEERMMRLGAEEIKINEMEIISTYEDFRNFIFYENYEYFLSLTPIENIKLFMIDECNFYAAIAGNFGILFLSDIESKIDYQRCLVFNGKQNIVWLNDFFDMLRKSAKRITLTKEFIHEKDLFLKYLEQVKDSTKKRSS